MHYLYATRKGCRKLSIASLIHYTFLFFYPWLTNSHVKRFSLSYANLFYYCFVNNYRKFFIVLKLSYFTKIFGRCLRPIIIHDVLFTSGNFNPLKEIVYFKIKLAGIRLFVTQRRRLPLILKTTIILFNALFSKNFQLYSSPEIFVILRFYHRNGGTKEVIVFKAL